MKPNKSLEDYLECILVLSNNMADVHQIDIARKLGVSQPAVLKAMNGLKEKNYIDFDGLHLKLTEQGKAYAKEVYRKHCVLRTFLQKLGVDEQTADVDACEIEHVISSDTFDKIVKFTEEYK